MTKTFERITEGGDPVTFDQLDENTIGAIIYYGVGERKKRGIIESWTATQIFVRDCDTNAIRPVPISRARWE